MASGRATRGIALGVAALACLAAGAWLAPRVRSGGGAAQAGASAPDAYRAEPGTALLEVLPPQSAEGGGFDAAWQRAIHTHAARIADPAVIVRVVEDRGAVAKTKWAASAGTPAHAGAMAAIARSLTVRPVPGTALIAVRVDVEPRSDAVLLTNTLCEEYLVRCRQLSEQGWSERIQALSRRLEDLEKRREERLAQARQAGREFGGDPELGRERVSAAAARFRRLEQAREEVGGARPTTGAGDARAAEDPEKLIRAAAAELEKAAEQLAGVKECHDDAIELSERVRQLRTELEAATRAQYESQSGVRVVLRATAGP